MTCLRGECTHIDTWRRRRSFGVGRVLVLNNPPALGLAAAIFAAAAANCAAAAATTSGSESSPNTDRARIESCGPSADANAAELASRSARG